MPKKESELEITQRAERIRAAIVIGIINLKRLAPFFPKPIKRMSIPVFNIEERQGI